MTSVILTPELKQLISTPSDTERAVAIINARQSFLSADEAVKMILMARVARREVAKDLRDVVGEIAIFKAITEELGFTFVDLDRDTSVKTDISMLNHLGVANLQNYTAIPVKDAAGVSYLALSNPGDIGIIDFLRTRPGSPQKLLIATPGHIRTRLAIASADAATSALGDIKISGKTSHGLQPMLPTSAGRNPVVDWVNGTLARAVTEGASDIHFEFNSDRQIQVRFRVDGILDLRQVGMQDRDLEVIGAILSRCSTMDPANLLLPQDGTFSFTSQGRTIDVRVAMLPMEYGPGVVLRLLDSGKIRLKLEDMGFSREHLRTARDVTASSQGLVLLSGPTGSGKTTTLYSLLKEVDAVTRRIVTVEDPIEYRLPNIGQVQIRSDRGSKSLTFALALRSILRMDPDVILVGEVRDTETARTAADAAITGHLVLSTIHASSAIATYTRMIEMNVPAFMVAEAISLTVAQRLVREVHECAVWQTPPDLDIAALQSMGLDIPEKVKIPVGCDLCNYRGYKGRIAVVEMLQPSNELKALVARRAPAADLKREAYASGFETMIHDAYRHMLTGRTTVSEVARLISVEEE